MSLDPALAEAPWLGWWRPDRRSDWRLVARGRSYADAWTALREAVPERVGQRLVTRVEWPLEDEG